MAFSKKVLEEKEALSRKVEDLIQAAGQREHQVANQIQELKVDLTGQAGPGFRCSPMAIGAGAEEDPEAEGDDEGGREGPS